MKIFNIVAVSVCLSGLFLNTSCKERANNEADTKDIKIGNISGGSGNISIGGGKVCQGNMINGVCQGKTIGATIGANCIQKVKKSATKNIAFNKFTQILNNSSATIELTQGSSFAITVNGDKAFVDALEIAENSDNLTIKESKCFENSDIRIEITLPTLNKITSSAEILTTSAFKGESIDLALTGSASSNLGLFYKNLNVSLTGSGKVTVNNGAAEIAKINATITGSGNLTLNTTKVVNNVVLNVTGSGSTSVSFKPQATKPSITANMTGSGNISILGLTKDNVSLSGSSATKVTFK